MVTTQVRSTLLGEKGLDQKLALLVSLCAQFDKTRFPAVAGPETAMADAVLASPNHPALEAGMAAVRANGGDAAAASTRSLLSLAGHAGAAGGEAGAGAGGGAAGGGEVSATRQRVDLVRQFVQRDLFRLNVDAGVSQAWV